MTAPESRARIRPRRLHLRPFLRCAAVYTIALGTALGLHLLGGGPPMPWTAWVGVIAFVQIVLIWVLQMATGRLTGASEGGRAVLLWAGPTPLPRGDALVFADADGMAVECKGGGWPMRIGLIAFLVIWASLTIAIADALGPPRDVHTAIIGIALGLALTVAFRVGAYPHRIELPYESLIEVRRDGRHLRLVARTAEAETPVVVELRASADYVHGTVEALHARGIDVAPGRAVARSDR